MTKQLEVKDLHLVYVEDGREFTILDHISFDLIEGEVYGLVGESGCGKSMTAMAIMRLFDPSRIKIKSGQIIFNGTNLLDLSEKQMRKVRTNGIAMIFQDPMTSLNPVYSVGKQIVESIREHKAISKTDAWREAIRLIELVGIPDPAQSAKKFPHEMSGGMRQRIVIAIALCCHPKLLIADEPTTALDVTVQHQILDLILDLKKRFNMSVILITHDLGLIAENTTRAGVMYAGNIIEQANVDQIFTNPRHPYTQGLMQCIPKLHEEVDSLSTIPGLVPPIQERGDGCLFYLRCAKKMDQCLHRKPQPVQINQNHTTACWLYN